MMIAPISNNILFKNVDKTYLRRLIKNQLVYVAKKDYLFYQDEPGEGMYVVLKGQLQVILNAKSSAPHTIATISKGSVIGEICLLSPQKRTASVKALKDSELIYIPAKQYQIEINKNNKNALIIGYNIALVLMKRLRKTNLQIEQLYQKKSAVIAKNEIASMRDRLIKDVLL
jgi:CRP-like cAMP-binding protein